MKITFPFKGDFQLTGAFGPRESFFVDGVWTLPFHYGVDWSMPVGTPIYAAHDGVVTKASFDYSGYGGGYEVALTSGSTTTWYLHMHPSLQVLVGQKVYVGQLLGYSGNSGLSTGPHLHFEQHINGSAVDPELYLGPPTYPEPTTEEEEEEEMKPTVHYRTDGGGEWTRAHPEIGTDLPLYKEGGTRYRTEDKVRVYRGFEVTSDSTVGAAWARTHAGGVGNETSRTDRAGYVAIQEQASRLSMELSR